MGAELAGKPRSVFNASDWTFETCQPALMALKHEVKESDDVEVQMGAFRVEMPKEWTYQVGEFFFHVRYMADTSDVQDAAFMTHAWNGEPNHIYIAVGGDDNATIMYWMGHRWELEGDLSMCDQSMRGLFAGIFKFFLLAAGVPVDIVDAIAATYNEPAIFETVKGGRTQRVRIDFLEEQLKTGVAHTSFSNTFVVGLLMIFALSKMVNDPKFTKAAYEIQPFDIRDYLITIWKELGITMKLAVYVDSPRQPAITYHKRYFVPAELGINVFSACPLPSAIMKMCCVKAPTK